MEKISSLRNAASHWNKTVDAAITILVVDDDTTCLSIIAAILKKLRYQVVTVKHANDALCKLRIREFDLVVSDVHMPDMNGFELQQIVAQEFNLPVVLMSADEEEGVALKGLEKGAAFFILKPVSPDDLRDLWQFTTMKKPSTSQVVIEEKSTSGESGTSDQTVNKRKSPQKEGSDDDKILGENSGSTKKPKVIWTNSLHNRFLEAIRSIGLDRAVPKKILEVMNVPGLTRENVASHLQKYRIFLRRVSDASFKLQYSVDKGLNRNLMRPSCESSSSRTPASPLTLTGFTKFNQNNHQFGTHFHSHSFPNLETSRFGQSRLLSNRGWSWPKPNTLSTRLAQNDYHTPNISLEDVLSTNFDAFPATTALDDHFPPQNNEAINSDITPSSGNFRYKSNYVGYSLDNIQKLTKSKFNFEVGSKSTNLGDDDHHQDNIKSLTESKFNFEGGLESTNLGDDHHHQDSIQNLTNSKFNFEEGLKSANLGDDHHQIQMQMPMPNEMNNNVYAEDQFTRASSPGGLLGDIINNSNINNNGEQLCDVNIEDYGMVMLPSDPPLVSNDDQLQFDSCFTPIFDLSDLDLISTDNPNQQVPLELEEELSAAFLQHDQLNIQNHQQQNNGSETSTNSSFYDDLINHWDNPLLSFDESPNQHQNSQGLMMSSHQEFDNSCHDLMNETVDLLINKPQVYGGELSSSLAFGTSSQLSKTDVSLIERDDDDFLDYLLTPFEEDQTPKGLI